MLLGSRRHRDHTSSRKDDYRQWNHESDSDRPRQLVAQHSAGLDKQHRRSSKRPTDVTNHPQPSSASAPNRYPTTRHVTNGVAVPSYANVSQTPQTQSQAAPTPQVASSSRARTQDNGHSAYDLREYLQRRTERRSPRSSEEKLYAPDPGPNLRNAAQQARGAYPSANPTPQALAPSQNLWMPPGQSTRDPASSTRHHRDRDPDGEESREQRRERKAKERAMREEQERMVTSGKDGGWEKERVPRGIPDDRAREQAYDIEELEKQKRHEERERRREERRREEHRREGEQRRREEEEARSRRHQDKKRSTREREARAQVDGLYYAVYPEAAPHGSTQPSTKQRGDDRLSIRRGLFLTDQIPSSSSNVALPATLQPPLGANGRAETSNDFHRDDPSPSSAPIPVPEKERKHRRSHRERALLQQAGQDSGFSSSEQEHSGRERVTHRTGERRRTREEDGHPSGPSGSETERMPGRERRRHRVDGDSIYPSDSRQVDSRRQSLPYPQAPASGPPVAASNALVGALSSQYVAPQVVSIRAGQGPADPQTPSLRSKTPAPSIHSRVRDVPPAPMQAQPSAGHSSASQGYAPQLHNASQVHSRTDGQLQQPQQPHSGASQMQTQSRTASHPSPRDPTRLQVPQQQYYSHNATQQVQQQAQYSNTSLQGILAHGTLGHQHNSIQSTQSPSAPTGPQPSNAHSTYTSPSAPNASAVPDNAPNVQANALTSTQYLQPIAMSKSASSTSLRKANAQATAGLISQTPAQVARLSMYRSPGPPVSADIIVPLVGDTKPQKASTQDLPARVPLHEDILTSASSSTLAPGTGRTTANVLPGHLQHQVHDSSTNQTNSHGPPPARSAPYTPLLHGVPVPNDSGMLFSPMKSSAHMYNVENEVPIPILPPKASVAYDALTYQHPSQQDAHTYEPVAPPMQATHSHRSNRLVATPIQPPQSAPAAAAPGHPSAKYVQPSAPPTSNAALAAVLSMPSSHSPARATQQPLQPSPSLKLPAQLGAATPRHSPSGRLAARNGSTETVTQIPAKSSPSGPSKSLKQRNSNASLRAAQPLSRPETKSSRPPATEYPDPTRYRTQASPAYPTNQVQTQTQANHAANTTSASNYAQTPSMYHVRSVSQPNTVSAPYDTQATAQRSRAGTAPAMMATPATAPSAAAIADEYRRGLYSSESSSRQQQAQAQRVPPRSAPSPAPTSTAPQPPAQSMLSKSGYATTTTLAQPPRSQTHPTVTRTQAPSGAPSHSRSVSDPQFARVAISGHPSTPAPPKVSLTYHPSPSEQELLKTPSSIARSVSKGSQLPPPTIRAAPSQPQSIKEKESRKRTFFSMGIFRSRSSPPKEETPSSSAPGAAPGAAPAKPRQRSTSQTTLTAVAASVRKIVAPHPVPSAAQPPPTKKAAPAPIPPPFEQRTPRASSESQRRRNPERPEMVAPTPVAAIADPVMFMGPAPKFHSGFRLLSRKHRAISDASVEAQDGTAPNTIIGGESARSSTAGRPSPPLRDPMEATVTWRMKEAEEQMGRGRRRRRPGVVFDVSDDFTETETHHPARKFNVRR